MRGKWLLAFTAAVCVVLAGIVPVLADHVGNPDMDLNNAYAIPNVTAEGDLLILVSYDLPALQWQHEAFMHTPVCADNATSTQDILDPCYTSLISGTALQTFYDGDPDAGGSLIGIRSLPRISNGLSAIYLSPGHGLTIGSTDYQTCVEGSASVFSPVPRSCSTLLWLASTTREQTRELAAPLLVQAARNLGLAAGFPATALVEIDRISFLGSVYFVEAFSGMVVAIPDAFVVGAGGLFSDVDTREQTGALESSIITAAESSNAFGAMERAGRQYIGVSGRVLGSWLAFVASVVAAIFVYAITRHYGAPNMAWAALAATPFDVFSVFMAWTPVNILWTMVLVMVFVGSMTLFRQKVPG